MENTDYGSWNMKGLIFEGVSGSGGQKQQQSERFWIPIPGLEKRVLSSIVLSEHQTMRVLERKQKDGELHLSDHITLLSKIVDCLEHLNSALEQMDWSSRYREAHKVPFLFERFHLSHVFHFNDLKWQDVQEIDRRLERLNASICVLEIDPESMAQRIIAAPKHQWKSYLETIGDTESEVIQYFIHQQEQLVWLSEQTKLPVLRINTSSKPVERIVEEILQFWKL